MARLFSAETHGVSSWQDCVRRVLRTDGCIVFLCEHGDACVHVNLRKQSFSEGQILILTPDIYCSVDGASADFEARYVSLSAAMLDMAYYKIPDSMLWEYLHQTPVLSLDAQQTDLVRAWMMQAAWIMDRTSGRTLSEMLGNKVYNLFAAAGVELASKCDGHKDVPKGRGWSLVARFLSLLATHSSARNGVAYYAGLLCITPDYLCKLCRRLYGASPKSFIEQQLVVDVKTLLADTDMTVGAIARRLGFEDASYMSRMFRRATGITPSRFRAGYQA